MNRSYIFKILREVYFFIREYYYSLSFVQASAIIVKHARDYMIEYIKSRKSKRITLFNDLWTIITISLIYIGIMKIGYE